MHPIRRVVSAIILSAALAPVLVPSPAHAQWTNRYPKVAGYGHHVYLEGYELPTLAAGPTDPAPSPDGTSLAVAARGWIWLLDPATGEARRLTAGAGMDSRPAWSPDGATLAFVRDDTRDTDIVLLDVASGEERVVVDEAALDLDPAFSPDGAWLYYASAVEGDLDLWRLELATGARERITDAGGLELSPLPHPDGERLLYLSKGRGGNQVRLRTLATGEERVLFTGAILSQTRPALSPDGRAVALNWPQEDGWRLGLVDIERPTNRYLLVDEGLPLMPAFGDDGSTVWFVEADDDERMTLWRVAAVGGGAERVSVRDWAWGEAPGRVRIVTRQGGAETAARIAVTDGAGHPVLPDVGQPRFDGQTGRVFVYSPGALEVSVPAGEFTVAAVRGLETPLAEASGSVEAGATATVTLDLEPVRDVNAGGWWSGDHHFHLNYGGVYDLDPEDLVLQARGEDLDVATPLLANLHNRFEDQDLWEWRREQWPVIRFAQEVRSHFLGHVSVVGARDLFWPWVWGPGYEVYGTDDRPNAEPLQHAREQAGLSVYVHPVMRPDPFAEENLAGLPIELIPDAVLGDLDALEVVCLWSDERGTAEVWHRFLSLGIPIAPVAGTDVMTDFYRTMAIGTTRVYARVGEGGGAGATAGAGAVTFESYLDAVRRGTGFVTNGPLLDFRVGGAGPGEVVDGTGEVEWTLELASAVPVERVEVLVNGEVVWGDDGLAEAGTRSYSGRVSLPSGGWIAARAQGGETVWPAMDSYPFAHTAAVWVGETASSDPAAARAAAADLLRALDVAERSLVEGYGEAEIPRLRERFREARERLEAIAGGAATRAAEGPAATQR